MPGERSCVTVASTKACYTCCMHPMTPIFFSTFACSVGLQLAVALLVQEDVISGHPWVQAYVAFCREWIPAIDRLAQVSSLPELTRLVVSLMWTLVPML